MEITNTNSSFHLKRDSYFGYEKINELQAQIMLFVSAWIKKEKTTVPHKIILAEMKNKGIECHKTQNALSALVTKKYLKRSDLSLGSRGTRYIQLRSI